MASLFKLMIVQVLICLEISLFFTSTMANTDFSEGFGRGSTKKLCGRMLVDALALICNNEYETIIHPSKRSDELFEEYYSDQPSPLIDDLPVNYQTYAYLSKLVPDAPELRSRVRREWVARRGVYDECCRKPCTVQELKSYCRQKN
ncbi:bombyxin B-1 homolog isoform X1 [Contarinia nasturtii]|uniref:bombyxin B-1 homolog isoform X1 n=1 Tax=Contarinia nasturtii TaxID=265458 RepID=UPI0012D3D629|nr:bombyxin B-1 homolog isoform X1 [Contarinia nasturtii]XP_031622183.1 bombyxin B-1 homolog isoform X1 [Contarinia nasturtii]